MSNQRFVLDPDVIHIAARHLQEQCHGASMSAGWWQDLSTGEDIILHPHVVGEKLCLIHSEVSEAMEGYRKGLMDDKLPHRKMIEVELADAVIRCFDLAGALGLDLAGAMAEKLAYNAMRADHKPENRAAEGGKKF
jgi:NTP pyrophosphatase (non-canonical NTP hydrolase)